MKANSPPAVAKFGDHLDRFARGKVSSFWREFQGSFHDALQALEKMAFEGAHVPSDMLYGLLKGCIERKDSLLGRKVHALAVRSGYETDLFLGNHIIRMYGCGGSLMEANQVFRKLQAPNVYVWASIISAHVLNRQPEKGIELYKQMRLSGVKPNEYVAVAALKACVSARDLASGKIVHVDLMDSGLEGNMIVCNSLVHMYAKCRSLEDAERVFEGVERKDVVTWNAMIAGYTLHGLGDKALEAYADMRQDGIVPDNVTFLSVLKACGNLKAIHECRQIHAEIMQRGIQADPLVGNALIDMYAKCGRLTDAHRVFDGLPVRDVVTWSTMMAGYVQHGLAQEALRLYDGMQQEGITADSVAFVRLLQACGSEGLIQEGKRIHGHILERGLESDVIVGNSLVDMYAKCGNLEEAHTVFDRLALRDVVTWSSLITGYVQHGSGEEALNLYLRMQENGITPDRVTFAGALKACQSIGAIQEGRQIHAQLLKSGLETDELVGSSLVHMYAKCGHLEDARKVFNILRSRNVLTWNAMILGYVRHKCGAEAVKLYHSMRQEGVIPDTVTFISALKACGSMGRLPGGAQIHRDIQTRGLEADLFVGNALVDMYIKCGSLEDAQIAFNSLPRKDVVTWSTIVAGYAHDGLGQEALKLYKSMLQDNIRPDNGTFLSALKACGSVGAIQEGKRIHAQILERGLENDVFLASTLVDMYAKCGNLEDAQIVFDNLSTRDVVTWNALINGYGKHNNYSQAVKCFDDMQRQGVDPDAATFTSLFVACSHVGKVNEGWQYFKNMVEKHGIAPEIEHYTSLVDLFGRSGRLDEAEKMLRSMPMEPGTVAWISLLSACKTFGNIELGRRCFDQLMELDSQQSVGYVLMSKIYADAGMWKEVEDIESLRKCAGVEKKLASAVIEVDNKVHEFTVGEMRDDIAAKLKSLNLLAENGSHLHSGSANQDKEDALCGHAEKLALAFGLLNTPQGSALLVTKNLRMCNHCHSGTKIISRFERREIVVRDAHRVHRFKDGTCSCGDHY